MSRVAMVGMALAVSAVAYAKPAALDRSKGPAAGAAPKLVLPKPEKLELSSGAKVLVVERHTLPMAVVSVVWPVGANRGDPAGKEGLAGLTADLLDEGAGGKGALELADGLESLGARLESGSGWDSTSVNLTATTRRLEPALAILGDVLARPAFDGKELERLRLERKTAITQMRDSASMVATNVFAKQLYGEARYGQPLIGTEEGLSKITREDVLGFWKDRLGPQGATIIVVGDVTAKTIKPQLEKALSGWSGAGTGTGTGRGTGTAAAKRAWVDREGAAQTEVRIGQPGVPRSHPDYFPIVVMNTILGGNFSSRLNTNLREKHGYTYGASSGMAFRLEGGPFQVASPVKTAVTAPALTEAMVELNAIRRDEVSAEELRRAKDQLERAMARRFETLEQLAGELAGQVVYKLPEDYFATFAAKIEAVTAAEVKRVANEQLAPDKMAIVLVGDRKELGEAVRKLGMGEFLAVDADGRPVKAPVKAAAKPPAR